jgi:hypothetical protein
VTGAAALGRLQSLPLQAQGVMSSALGSGAASFAMERYWNLEFRRYLVRLVDSCS